MQCVSAVPTPWAAAALRIFTVYFRNQFVLLFPVTTGNTYQSIKKNIHLSERIAGAHIYDPVDLINDNNRSHNSGS